MKYYWVRIFDYKKEEEETHNEDEFTCRRYKGALLDEYYLKGEEMTRKQAKDIV